MFGRGKDGVVEVSWVGEGEGNEGGARWVRIGGGVREDECAGGE